MLHRHASWSKCICTDMLTQDNTRSHEASEWPCWRRQERLAADRQTLDACIIPAEGKLLMCMLPLARQSKPGRNHLQPEAVHKPATPEAHHQQQYRLSLVNPRRYLGILWIVPSMLVAPLLKKLVPMLCSVHTNQHLPHCCITVTGLLHQQQ